MGTIMISSECEGPARMARAESPRGWGDGALHAAAYAPSRLKIQSLQSELWPQV